LGPPNIDNLEYTRGFLILQGNIMVIVYVLKGTKRYVGITNDLDRRLLEHKRKTSKGSQMIGEFKVIYTREYPDYKSAREQEKFLKSGAGRTWLDHYEDGLSQP